MKVKSLSAAVGVASVIMISGAQAGMYINELGTGETLLFPFYSAENGNNTLVNIANASTSHKAVKVRILEAQNSQEVLDYNLYLSPEDHFSFSISASAEGGAKMVTTDKSCTSPEIPADGEAFRTIKFDGDTNNGLSRTQVGYIEVIEMGQLNPNADPVIDEAGLADPAVTAINAAAAITHDANGVPAGCDIINKAWSSNGVWTAESKTTSLTGDSEFLANWAGGGLYGFATVINVRKVRLLVTTLSPLQTMLRQVRLGQTCTTSRAIFVQNFTDPAMDTAAIVSVNGKAVTLDFAGDYPSSAVERIQAMNALIMKTEVHNGLCDGPSHCGNDRLVT